MAVRDFMIHIEGMVCMRPQSVCTMRTDVQCDIFGYSIGHGPWAFGSVVC